MLYYVIETCEERRIYGLLTEASNCDFCDCPAVATDRLYAIGQ